ncbi:hypothetical protein E2562_013016 [Oryza meyeriana var. granulata]|uniref:Uncharacterized protein n=1 Tax=Oryza meyeriana var. granulata TaxID=110450 RepID=A0A6G1DI96_9ORYZ|nr:hypothetical protein E2562_013016 [Oryza meyeriana var. granulata]
MKLLFVEMGVDYDQHDQDIIAAAMRAGLQATPELEKKQQRREKGENVERKGNFDIFYSQAKAACMDADAALIRSGGGWADPGCCFVLKC